MENIAAQGTASLSMDAGGDRVTAHIKTTLLDDYAAHVTEANVYSDASSPIGPTTIDRLPDVAPNSAGSDADRPAKRPYNRERRPEIISRPQSTEALIPHDDARANTAPEYMHLWAAIERHFSHTTSQSSVLNELIATTPPFVLGITSAVVGEGKTTVAMNLAESAARNTWYRVCLVDLGLDGDEISLRHGIESDGTGVVGLLEDSKSGQFTSQSLPTYRLEDRAGLTVLPAGKPPLNPARTARSPHLGPLLECMRDKFDLIIVDLPAVSTDNALPIASAMDGIVVVARAGATPAGVIGEAVNKIGRDAVIGVVLNRIKFSGPSWLKKLLVKW